MISKAIVGGGCFWCIEAVLQRLKGVSKVESGYTAGKIENPTYKQVCEGTTGHAEVVRVTYDSKILPYHDLLYVFMSLHDPTTLNRQGNDSGTQYRSIIMYETEEELREAKNVIEEIQKLYTDKIVTELVPLKHFYPAEEYHQNYYNENSGQGYCRAIIKPKIEKLQNLYSKYLEK